jgi:hypothetical protein
LSAPAGVLLGVATRALAWGGGETEDAEAADAAEAVDAEPAGAESAGAGTDDGAAVTSGVAAPFSARAVAASDAPAAAMKAAAKRPLEFRIPPSELGNAPEPPTLSQLIPVLLVNRP